MNPELVRALPDRLIARQKTLARVCFNLAFNLSGGEWYDPEMRHTKMGRTVGRELSDKVIVAGRIIPAVSEEMTVSFLADKRAILEDDTVKDYDYYTVSVSTTQVVASDEVPVKILEEIREDIDEDDEPEMVDDISSLDPFHKDEFNRVVIEKETLSTYGIWHDGAIEEHSLVHTYYFDKHDVHETTIDTRVGVGEPERQPIEIDQLAHRRQVLSILGLAASGMYDMRRLARR